jgi:Histidine kinase-, DNA gyrase B-, and HSP90-like ATPase/ABC transporter substrate binding protein
MRRRDFLVALGGAATWPLAARAQQVVRIRRIGVLTPFPADDAEGHARLTAFAQGLQQLGWTVGQNIRIDYRWGDGKPDTMRKFADELISLGPDVILANASTAVSPLLQATRAVPIVFAAVADPVGAGYVETLARPGGNAFKVDMPSSLPPGRGDERRLTQVLLNLVGNAIKFTDDGEVAIQATASNGAFSLLVRDTGPGISETDQAKLFQEFQQADNSITRKKGGTGLGLAISKRIIELHGGDIHVESTLGAGSTFSIRLPVQADRKRG